MNAVTTHERPGVYSVYTASAALNARPGQGRAGIAALSQGGTAGQVYDLGSYAEAVEAFGREDALTGLVRVLLANGAARVLAVPVRTQGDYAAALDRLEEQEELKTVVCDSSALTVQQSLRASVERSSAAGKERIALVCAPRGETATQLTERAKGLNSERMVLVAPAPEEGNPALAAAAAAGAICAGGDPALPLGGAELRGIAALDRRFTEQEVDTLIRGGVTPVEMVGGRCLVIRAVTTRTTSGGAADRTWRELGTILVADDVIPAVRRALQTRFARAKNTPQTRAAIRSQVILVLEEKLAAEIITGYEEVTVQPLEEDPTVCLVTFAFTIAHGLNQIWLSARLTV